MLGVNGALPYFFTVEFQQSQLPAFYCKFYVFFLQCCLHTISFLVTQFLKAVTQTHQICKTRHWFSAFDSVFNFTTHNSLCNTQELILQQRCLLLRRVCDILNAVLRFEFCVFSRCFRSRYNEHFWEKSPGLSEFVRFVTSAGLHVEFKPDLSFTAGNILKCY